MTIGPLIIISGASGSGKSTVVERLLAATDLPLRRAVTATTRSPRPGEVDGVSYHFWPRERFARAIESGEMLEFATVHEFDYYGTPRSEVEPHREAGTGVVLVIDVQGAAQVRQACPDAFSVFLYVPPEELERRLMARGTETPESIERRLRSGRDETARAGEYSLQLANHRLDETVRQLQQVLQEQFTRRG
jgi:guanylate kinase